MRIYKPKRRTYSRRRNKKQTLQKGSGKIQISYYDLPAYKTPTEDRISPPIISQDLIILALFDGHSGASISELLHTNLPNRIHRRIGLSQDTGTIIQILNEEFERMDTEIGTYVGGSTATIVIITKTEIIVANVGDSPAILFKKDGTVLNHTDDHDCSNAAELKRITKAGGKCIELQGKPRLQTGLAVTRAFGDYVHNKQIVISTPQIYVWPKQPDTLICLCSDSFTEGYYNFEEAGQPYRTIANIYKPKDIVNELLVTLNNHNFNIEKSARAAVERRVAAFGSEGDNTSLILAYLPTPL